MNMERMPRNEVFIPPLTPEVTVRENPTHLWSNSVTLKNWIIDLRVDFETKEQEELMLTQVRTAAKELLTTARLLADKRKPDISIHNDDMYEGRDQVEMFTPEEKAEYGI